MNAKRRYFGRSHELLCNGIALTGCWAELLIVFSDSQWNIGVGLLVSAAYASIALDTINLLLEQALKGSQGSGGQVLRKRAIGNWYTTLIFSKAAVANRMV